MMNVVRIKIHGREPTHKVIISMDTNYKCVAVFFNEECAKDYRDFVQLILNGDDSGQLADVVPFDMETCNDKTIFS